MIKAIEKISNLFDKSEIDREVSRRVESSPTAKIVNAIYEQHGWDVSGNFWTNDTGYIAIHWSDPGFDIDAKMQGSRVVFSGDGHSSWTVDLNQALIDARVHSEIYHYKPNRKRLE